MNCWLNDYLRGQIARMCVGANEIIIEDKLITLHVFYTSYDVGRSADPFSLSNEVTSKCFSFIWDVRVYNVG